MTYSWKELEETAMPMRGPRVILASVRPGPDFGDFERLPEDPQAAELLALTIPNAAAAEMLVGSLDQDFSGLGSGARARLDRFIEFLAANPDSRLREAAARSPKLTQAQASALSRDRSCRVRERLSWNYRALLMLRPGELIGLCRDDGELLAKLLDNLLKSSAEGRFRTVDERVRAVGAVLSQHADPTVRAETKERVALWEEIRKKVAAEGPPCRWPEDWTAPGGPDDYVWFLAAADPDAAPDGTWLTAKTPVLPFGLKRVRDLFFWNLPEGEPSAPVLERLARHSSGRVRATVAILPDIPPAAAGLLARDPLPGVRQRLSENRAAMALLTEDEILACVHDRPALVEAFRRGGVEELLRTAREHGPEDRVIAVFSGDGLGEEKDEEGVFIGGGDESSDAVDPVTFCREACYEDRMQAAGLWNLPAAAARLLAADPQAAVRERIAGNDAALALLSEEEILGCLQGDPALIEEACENCPDARVARILMRAYADAADPRVIDRINWLGTAFADGN